MVRWFKFIPTIGALACVFSLSCAKVAPGLSPIRGDADGYTGHTPDATPVPKLAVKLHPEKIKVNRDSSGILPVFTVVGSAGAVTVDSGNIADVWFRAVEASKSEISGAQDPAGDGVISGAFLNGQQVLNDGSFEVSFTKAVAGVLVLAAGTPGADSEKQSGDVLLKTNAFTTFYVVYDQTGDGCIDISDIQMMAVHWEQSVPPHTLGDVNGDGMVNKGDQHLIGASGLFSQCPTGSTLPVRLDFRFDQNGDGCLDVLDLNLLLAKYATHVTPLSEGDVNGDGKVNDGDITLMRYIGQWNQCVSPAAQGVQLVTRFDTNSDGCVTNADLAFYDNYSLHLNPSVPPGSPGDIDGNGILNYDDLTFMESTPLKSWLSCTP